MGVGREARKGGGGLISYIQIKESWGHGDKKAQPPKLWLLTTSQLNSQFQREGVGAAWS